MLICDFFPQIKYFKLKEIMGSASGFSPGIDIINCGFDDNTG